MTKAQVNYVKLIMVTEDNNNKFYEMKFEGCSTFTATWGRVESTSKSKTYGYGEWDRIYNEKVNKGYKDVTEMVSVTVDKTKTPEKIADVGIPMVDMFLTRMKAYTDGLVAKTYSVKCTSVTQTQLDTAQKLIDDLVILEKKKATKSDVNKVLLELYSIIPRYMGKTTDYLMPSITLKNIIGQEQDNLDAMTSQVKMYNPVSSKVSLETVKKSRSLLSMLNITMDIAKDTKEIDYLLKQLKKEKVKCIFEVNKPKEDTDFEAWKASRKDQSTKMLLHGTKNASVIPILEIGLKIRPSGNFQFSGKAYGNGNYFSEVTDKSLGYTSWGEKDRVLLVYEVHTGNPFVYGGWYRGNSFELNLKELTSRGYDSTYVKAGSGLLNSEIIAYSEKQNRIKYIIWLE